MASQLISDTAVKASDESHFERRYKSIMTNLKAAFLALALSSTSVYAFQLQPVVTAKISSRQQQQRHQIVSMLHASSVVGASGPLAATVDDSSSSNDAGVSAEANVHGAGQTYVKCGKCEALYYLDEEDLGTGRGRRLQCALCQHSWFQSKGRLMSIKEGFEMVPLPSQDVERIALNIQEGKSPKFLGDSKLYVGNISFECEEDDIFQIFSEVGNVGDVSLVRDDSGKNRGFGFVTMRTQEDAEKAISQLDGTPVKGRNIAVRESNT